MIAAHIPSLMIALFMGTQDPPPPPVIHFFPPKEALIDVRADCWGRPVRYRIQAKGGAVRILSYSGAAGRASRAQLAQWNEWLAPMKRISSHQFQCRGPNESLSILGVTGEIDGAIRVHVQWEDGYLRLYPDEYSLSSAFGAED